MSIVNPFDRDRDRDYDRDDDRDLGTRGAENKAGGTMDKVTGKVEEVAGDLTGNDRMQAEGRAKQMKGDLKHGLGEAQDRLDDAADDLTH
jgi:uncharacterized protein YjbJ (UPF0337 family)